ncbi:hypothetical protein NDU88_001966 [Pleurodeles waltl]|uniref:Uncharacterized protein n=1 Tax=Pleurodeles waltl TaxID=8319 RepID=A0AAV7KQZ3_PLEWA|nr:hypothetical protein NDU88_001966 [Pleurodeles waltl]
MSPQMQASSSQRGSLSPGLQPSSATGQVARPRGGKAGPSDVTDLLKPAPPGQPLPQPAPRVHYQEAFRPDPVGTVPCSKSAQVSSSTGQNEPQRDQQPPPGSTSPTLWNGGTPRGRPKSAAAPEHRRGPISQHPQRTANSSRPQKDHYPRRASQHLDVAPPDVAASPPRPLEPLGRRPQRIMGARGSIIPPIRPLQLIASHPPSELHSRQRLSPLLAHQPGQESQRPSVARHLILPGQALHPGRQFRTTEAGAKSSTAVAGSTCVFAVLSGQKNRNVTALSGEM